MKPDFDLNDPKVRGAINFGFAQIAGALQYTHRIEDAVCPIYWTLRSATKPEQVGSGVVVELKGEYFIFSASHVFDEIGGFQLLIGTGGGNKLCSLSGERFSSLKGKSGTHVDDSIDASVFHIQSNIPNELKKISLKFDDLDISQPDGENFVHMAVGFRSKESSTLGNQANAKRESFPSREYGEKEYSILDINKEMHLALAYEDQVLINGNWQKSPTPTGISGGGMIKVSGVSFSPLFLRPSEPKALLSAITIAYRKEKAGKPGVLIGTRIGVHLGLIHQCLPDLFTES